ncbi:MAG: hypothetical protein Q8P92_02145 [Candidatus Daviesbacteria bacterium]|nr:hypothetical protein [Candidatus Daviesbacteria bacterium]
MKNFITKPIHPFLFALFPTFAFVAHNFDELIAEYLTYPTVFLTLFVFILWLLVSFFISNRQKSALVVSAVAFLTSYLIDFKVFLYDFRANQFFITNQKKILFLAIFLVFTIFVIRKITVNFRKITILLNIFSLSFLMIPTTQIIYKQALRALNPVKSSNIIVYNGDESVQGELPDIYYIIVDRYASRRILDELYNFDNSEFINFLKNRGFFVAKTAANYPFTVSSLASSLNMIYLDNVVEQVDRGSDSKRPLIDMIQDSEVARYLKNKGYKYLNFGFSWEHNAKNKNADYNYAYEPKELHYLEKLLDELDNNSTNFLGSFLTQTLKDQTLGQLTGGGNYWNFIIDQILEVSRTTKIEGPKFVFYHSFLAHDPYIFDRDGNPQATDQFNMKEGAKKLYVEQLIFANKVLMNLIDTLLKDSEKPPIIILQADEGPYPKRFRQQLDKFNWRTATVEELKEKMRIISAYYFPGGKTDLLYQTISPVNSFRVILNTYFGENLPLLPDKNYAQVYSEFPYDVFEVTNIVK